MSDPPAEETLSRFAHAFGSPLTAIQGSVRMLMLLTQGSASPEQQHFLEIIDRNTRRLTVAVERVLSATTVDERALRVTLPLQVVAEGLGVGIAATAVEEAAAEKEHAFPPDQPLILVVDDDPLAREALAEPLRGAGWTVLPAPDAAAAIDLARTYRPALITLDLAMPGVDGQRLLPVFKEDPALKEIPVLIVSSMATGGWVNVPGAVGALSKPVHREVLLRMVSDILKPAEEERQKGKILVVDDEEELRRPLAVDLNERGYAVFELSDGSAVIEAVRFWEPDMVLLDLRLPDTDGMELLQQLKEDWRTSTTPIILLSSERRAEEKARAFQYAADDYVTKPYDIVELAARIEAVLRRKDVEFSVNPSTRLPGNIAIERVLRQHVAVGDPLAVCYIDLDNFKAYNDVYGFLKGDGVIRQTARVLTEAVHSIGNPDDFIGHVGGDDFVAITTPDRADAICQRIKEEFDQVIPLYYDADARSRGYIETIDRQGQPARFPLMAITMVIVTNEERTIEHPGQIADMAAELKHRAKSIPGSVILRDRRGG